MDTSITEKICTRILRTSPYSSDFLTNSSSRRVAGLVQSTDIAPTILKAIGLDIPTWMDGQALTEDGDPINTETIAVNFKHPVEGHPLSITDKAGYLVGTSTR